MRTYIFTDRERRILEAYLTNADFDKIGISRIKNKIRKNRALFEDVYLYLQVRKAINT